MYANLSMGMLERFKPALRLNGSMSIGNATDLPRMLSSAVIEKEISKLKMILDECYPVLSTISDGSPIGTDTECLIVRAVDGKNSLHKASTHFSQIIWCKTIWRTNC